MAGKRGNSEGSIRKRSDERWEARFVGVDGKRHSLYRTTRQEAARALLDALQDREHGITAPPKHQTVGEYLTFWMEMVKRHTVDPSSYVRDEYDVRIHLIPAFGKLPLAKLTAQHLQSFYARKLAEEYAPATVRHVHITLHNALDYALTQGLVARNVAVMATPPRPKRKEMAILSEDQVRQLRAAVEGQRLEALISLALATGMREGELMVLTWADVDLEQAQLRVRHTLHRVPHGYAVEEAKTQHSRRTIALSATVVEVLRRHRQAQFEERLLLGPAWQDLDLVFPNEAGGLLSRRIFQVEGWFGRMLRHAQIPAIRFHDLRHTAATLLLARGINPKVVSEMLGHASVAITLTLYGHVTPHMQRQAAQTIDAVFAGDSA